MKQKSLTKLSTLGSILLAASAVTAAIIPSKSKHNEAKQANSADNATLVSNSGLTPAAGGIRSCVVDQAGDDYFSCHLTVSYTATGSLSEAMFYRTDGNTSNSWNLSPGDTTSVVL